MLLLIKYANLLKGSKRELAFGVKKNIKLLFRSQPKKSLEEAVLICIQLLTNFQNTLGKKIDEMIIKSVSRIRTTLIFERRVCLIKLIADAGNY